MDKDQGKNIYYKTLYDTGFISLILHILISLMLIFVLSGCGVFEGEFFGKEFGGSVQDPDESSFEEAGDLADEDSETSNSDDDKNGLMAEGPDGSESQDVQFY